VTSHPLAAELCRHWGGPLVSTSANIHGRPPATTPLAIRKVFDDRLDYILHGPTGAGKKPSEIRDAITGDIIR
jgi:L-threonylcarbamoyladenylate synthase